jgi:hypothetical protein
LVTDRSIYCHLTRSDMNYLLYYTFYLKYCRSIYYRSIYEIIVPQYINITTIFSTLKLLFFSFSSCFTIERSIVFKTMDRQCESFSRIFSSETGLDKSFMFTRKTRTSSSINENSEILKNFQNFKNVKKIQNFHKISKFSKIFKNFSSHHVNLC